MYKISGKQKISIFAVIGVLFIVVSSFLANRGVDWLQSLLFNLGIVAIATLLIDFMWEISGGAPWQNEVGELGTQVDRLQKSIDAKVEALATQVDRLGKSIDVIDAINEVGLMDVTDRMGNFGTQHDWVQLISNANDSVDLMGRTLHGWASYDGFYDLFARKIRDGVSFRWLIMSPENEFQGMLTEEGAEIDPVLRQKRDVMLKLLTRLFKELPAEIRPRLQIRLFKHVPLYSSVLRVDDTTYWCPYLCSNQAQNCPLLTLHGKSKGWSKILEHEFQSVWNFSQLLSENGDI